MIDKDSQTVKVPANLEKLAIGDRVAFKHQRREGVVTGCMRSGNLGFADRKQEWMLTVAYFGTGGECFQATLPVECFEVIIPNPNFVDDDEEEDLGPRPAIKAKTRGGFVATSERLGDKLRGRAHTKAIEDDEEG